MFDQAITRLAPIFWRHLLAAKYSRMFSSGQIHASLRTHYPCPLSHVHQAELPETIDIRLENDPPSPEQLSMGEPCTWSEHNEAGCQRCQQDGHPVIFRLRKRYPNFECLIGHAFGEP